MRIDVEQGTDSWHTLRRSKIGASDSAALLGLSPFKNSDMLYEEKVYGTRFSNSPAMQRGQELETEAREVYENLVHLKMEPAVFVHDKRPWMMASLDGYNEKEKRGVEIKCPGEKSFWKIKRKGTPIYYKVQLVHQMLTVPIRHVDFFVYHPLYGYYLMEHSFDASLGIQILREGKKFYNRIKRYH